MTFLKLNYCAYTFWLSTKSEATQASDSVCGTVSPQSVEYIKLRADVALSLTRGVSFGRDTQERIQYTKY